MNQVLNPIAPPKYTRIRPGWVFKAEPRNLFSERLEDEVDSHHPYGLGEHLDKEDGEEAGAPAAEAEPRKGISSQGAKEHAHHRGDPRHIHRVQHPPRKIDLLTFPENVEVVGESRLCGDDTGSTQVLRGIKHPLRISFSSLVPLWNEQPIVRETAEPQALLFKIGRISTGEEL
jgi:hypothetical protein